jgi:hypothetical protein
MHTKFLLENLNGRNLGVNVKTIIEWILAKEDRKVWTGFSWLKFRIKSRPW